MLASHPSLEGPTPLLVPWRPLSCPPLLAALTPTFAPCSARRSWPPMPSPSPVPDCLCRQADQRLRPRRESAQRGQGGRGHQGDQRVLPQPDGRQDRRGQALSQVECNFVSAQPLCDPQRRRISNPVYCTISMYHFDVSQLRSARAGVWLSPAPRGVLSRYLGKSRKSQVGSSRLWIWTDLEHLRGSDRHSLRTLSVWGSHVLCRMWVLSSCSAPIEAGACMTLAIKDSWLADKIS